MSNVMVGYMLAAMAVMYFMQRIVTAGINGFTVYQSEVIGFGLIFLTFCTVVAQKIFYGTYIGFDGIDTLANISTILFISTLWFLIGGYASTYNTKESLPVAIVIVGALALALGLGASDNLTVDYFEIMEESGVASVSHLVLERHVILLLAFAYAMSSSSRFVVLLGGVLVLLLMGGRSALFIFVVTAILMNLRGKMVKNMLVMGVLGMVVFIGARFLVSEGIVDVQSSEVREILFLDGLNADASFNARIGLMQDGFVDLPDQFLIGNFALTAERQGHSGGYIHNLLSAWQFYGFFVFVAIVLSLVYCFRRMQLCMKHRSSPIDVFGAFMLIYVIINVILAKNVAWNLLWFVLGLWLLKPPLKLHRPHTRNSRNRKRVRRQA